VRLCQIGKCHVGTLLEYLRRTSCNSIATFSPTISLTNVSAAIRQTEGLSTDGSSSGREMEIGDGGFVRSCARRLASPLFRLNFKYKHISNANVEIETPSVDKRCGIYQKLRPVRRAYRRPRKTRRKEPPPFAAETQTWPN
jgi:hypothetical protein